MKIGILTFHRSINNGAVMQCYSLSKKLQSEFPDDVVEVIDYHMPKIEKFYTPSLVNYFSGGGLLSKAKRAVRLFLHPGRLVWQKKRKRAFDSVKKNLPLSKQEILDDGTQALFDYINKNYDVVIAGSDAIWNYVSRGFPNPYFLGEEVLCAKLSYAASCYGMNYESIPDEQKNAIGKILSTYEFLGVRDDESAMFLKFTNCSAPAVHTCDPTVFLDVNDLPIQSELLEQKLAKRGFDFSRPTIGVMGTDDMCNMIRRFYGKQYQIVALYNYCRNADVNLYDLTPYEWAYMFRYFRVTVTTFFHGTLLSLRNGTPVVCVALETAYSAKHTTKVQDFLRRVNLEDSYFHTDYKTKNLAAVKAKIDDFLKADLKSIILERMDKEALSLTPLIEAINQIKTKR